MPEELPWGEDFTDEEFPEERAGSGSSPTVGCPACRADVYEDLEHCPQCGEDLEALRCRKRWPVWWWAGLVLALGVALLFFAGLIRLL